MMTFVMAGRSHPLELLIRKPRPGDQGYVASTWVEQLVRADRLASKVHLGLLVDAMLDHPAVEVLLACDSTRSGIILGWLAYTPVKAIRLVHFAYTRRPSRDQGVQASLRSAAGLADARPLVYTMLGTCAKSLLKKYPAAIHQPVQEFLR